MCRIDITDTLSPKIASWRTLWSYNASLPSWTRRANSQTDVIHCASNASWTTTPRTNFDENSGGHVTPALCLSVSSSLPIHPIRIPLEWFKVFRSPRPMMIWMRSVMNGERNSAIPAMGHASISAKLKMSRGSRRRCNRCA